MRRHTIELTEHELRLVLHAFDVARDETINPGWRAWYELRRNQLYERIREHGIVARQELAR